MENEHSNSDIFNLFYRHGEYGKINFNPEHVLLMKDIHKCRFMTKSIRIRKVSANIILFSGITHKVLGLGM